MATYELNVNGQRKQVTLIHRRAPVGAGVKS